MKANRKNNNLFTNHILSQESDQAFYLFFIDLFILVHLSRRRFPSSVRPSSLTFHIFDFFSETAEQNSNLTGDKNLTSSTKLGGGGGLRVANLKTKMAAL